MSEHLRVCRKCLLREETEEAYFKKLDLYIANLNEDDRVGQEQYESRLAACAACPRLMNGMCRVCGCFVELRAALKVRKCPDIPRKW